MQIIENIKYTITTAIKELFDLELAPNEVLINKTKQEFTGDYTIVLFGLVKQLKQNPEDIGNKIGNFLKENNSDLFLDFNVIKGFLNVTIQDAIWAGFLNENANNSNYGIATKTNHTVMVEYSSPNTNKPLHLGHLRNIFLGWSIAEIFKTLGNKVIKTCIVNDRGIHICKSMIAWQLFANGDTPEKSKLKGDHFVGKYYVKFNEELKKQTEALLAQGVSKENAEKETPIMKATQQMLLDWEDGNEAVLTLWKTMNNWVYSGFDITYKNIGSDFDKIYYESDTYLLGKNLVETGLSKNVFYKKEDGSVWIDLQNEGLDEKLVQRKDGTSVYITQDIGLAAQRYTEYEAQESIYVIGDEQNYHMKVLKLICQKLQLPGSNGMHHLSYGMVELPEGKMKSREGTVVDADDLVEEMINISKQKTEELGKVSDFSSVELDELNKVIGLGALKFFLLRVDPKKKMIFDPVESIDFHGFTAPFIQYTHARIKSILRKNSITNNASSNSKLLPLEKEVVRHLELFNATLLEAAKEHDPSKIAIYVFNLAQVFNSFYAQHSIAHAENENQKLLRLQIASLTAHVIKKGMHVLGIEVPERM
ncbi:MAG TPA: arginine--tRNA ligase [Chitinophagaceae bacterium]|nr:arginine--tRNA ligase [Chitinophagaceae bacterium]